MTLRLARNVLIKIDANNVGGAGASWTAIGQQTSGGRQKKNNMLDGTVKGDLGWTKEVPLSRSWTVTCEGKLDPADSIYQMLDTAWTNSTTVWVQVDLSSVGGAKKEGQAYVELDEKFDQGGFIEFTCTFSMQGAPVTSSV